MMRHISAATSMTRAILYGGPKYMIFHVTALCNARCRMCFNWEGMQQRRSDPGPDLGQVRRLASSINVLPQLTLSGGEPLLRKELSHIIELFYRHARTRFFSLPTNSLRPDLLEALLDAFTTHCPDAFLNVCLPFHGDAHHYDDIMGVPGNFVKFNESYALIKQKQKQHPNISCVLNFVMSKFNYDRYKDIIDMAFNMYSEAPLGIAFCRGVTHEADATDVPLQAYLDAQDYLFARKRRRASMNPYTIMFDTIGLRIARRIAGVHSGEINDLRCKAGKRFIVVYDNGDVFPCEMLDVLGMPPANTAREAAERPVSACLGNLRHYNYNMQSLLASENARRVISWLDAHGCACTWECAVYSRILHDPHEWGGIARAMGRATINRYLPF